MKDYEYMHKLCLKNSLEKYKPRPRLLSYNKRNSVDFQISSPERKHGTKHHKKSCHFSALKDWSSKAINIHKLSTEDLIGLHEIRPAMQVLRRTEKPNLFFHIR